MSLTYQVDGKAGELHCLKDAISQFLAHPRPHCLIGNDHSYRIRPEPSFITINHTFTITIVQLDSISDRKQKHVKLLTTNDASLKILLDLLAAAAAGKCNHAVLITCAPAMLQAGIVFGSISLSVCASVCSSVRTKSRKLLIRN